MIKKVSVYEALPEHFLGDENGSVIQRWGAVGNIRRQLFDFG